MKKFLLCVSFVSICLFGCLNSEEEVTINADGSGVYTNAVDMSGLFDMMPVPVSTDSSENNGLQKFLGKNIDSSILFKSFIDTVSSLTADQKKLFEKATMRININQKEKIFKLITIYPFDNIDDLQQLIDLQQKNKVPNPFKQSMGSNEMPETENLGFPAIDKIMNVSFKNGLIERKVNREQLNDLKGNEQFSEMGKAQEMLEAITFSSSFHLPKPAKNVTGEKLKLSNDKKTVTVTYTLLDMMKAPSSLEFKVEY